MGWRLGLVVAILTSLSVAKGDSLPRSGEAKPASSRTDPSRHREPGNRPEGSTRRIALDSSFAPTGSLTTPRYEHTATLLKNGSVLIVGGYDGNTDLTSAELYDPGTGMFVEDGDMLRRRRWTIRSLRRR